MRVEMLGATLGGPSAHVSKMAERPSLTPAEIDRVWQELTSANGALYDGPILCVEAFEASSGSIRCSRSSFRHLAAADRLGLATRQLGIVGWLTGRSRDGREHVLLGRRSSATRVYQGLWENAPSGGVPPRVMAAGASEAGVDTLFEALREEAEEELALDLPAWKNLEAGRARVRRWIVDDLARSLDVVVEIEMGETGSGTIDPRTAGGVCANARPDGEYVDVAWVARDEWRDFVRSHSPSVLSPPTVALAESLGWRSV